MISYFKINKDKKKNRDDICQYKQSQLTFGTSPSGLASQVFQTKPTSYTFFSNMINIPSITGLSVETLNNILYLKNISGSNKTLLLNLSINCATNCFSSGVAPGFVVEGTVNFGYDNAINNDTTILLRSTALNYTCNICNIASDCNIGKTVPINGYTKVNIMNNQAIRLKVFFNCTVWYGNCGFGIGAPTYMNLNLSSKSSCIINLLTYQ